jgi:hypothetical protein
LEDLWMLEKLKGKLKYMESWIRAWNTNNGEYFSPLAPITGARTLTTISAWSEKTARMAESICLSFRVLRSLLMQEACCYICTHYQKTGEKQRNYRQNISVGNVYRRK